MVKKYWGKPHPSRHHHDDSRGSSSHSKSHCGAAGGTAWQPRFKRDGTSFHRVCGKGGCWSRCPFKSQHTHFPSYFHQIITGPLATPSHPGSPQRSCSPMPPATRCHKHPSASSTDIQSVANIGKLNVTSNLNSKPTKFRRRDVHLFGARRQLIRQTHEPKALLKFSTCKMKDIQ